MDHDEYDTEQLAELESLLYSQIHHATTVEPDSNAKEAETNLSSKIRNLTPKRNVNSPNQPIVNTSALHKKVSTSNTISTQVTPQKSGSVTEPQQQQYFQSMSSFSNPLPQTIHLSSNYPIQFIQPPVNNIVFMPHGSLLHSATLTRAQRRKLNKQTSKELKKATYNRVMLGSNDAEVFKTLNPEDRIRAMKIQKRQRYIQKRKEQKKLEKEQKLIERHNNTYVDVTQQLTEDTTKSNMGMIPNSEIIELSESDEAEVVQIEEKPDLVVLSSDDEIEVKSEFEKPSLKASTVATVLAVETIAVDLQTDDDEDVQFVEILPSKPILKSDSQLMRPPTDLETTSLSSTASIHSNDKSVVTPTKSKTKRKLNERGELLNTPESSNDFLDNSLDISLQDKFNFSLHGNDLIVDKTFVRPKNLAEVYESESSCSTSDFGSGTPLKSAVFNELEFETPANALFDENLESFSVYITPKRKSSTQQLAEDGVQDVEEVTICETQLEQEKSDSDSSSESEYEEKAPAKSKSRKRLPSLSYFEEEPPQVQEMSKVDKKKDKHKTKALKIKDANVNKTSDKEKEEEKEAPVETEKTGEVKKSKKRKKNSDVQTMEESAKDKTGSGKKRKRQKSKSKSDTELETLLEEIGNQVIRSTNLTASTLPKNNKKSKKNKSKSDTEVETNEKDSSNVVVETLTETPSPSKTRKKRKSKSENEDTLEILPATLSSTPVVSSSKNKKDKAKSKTATEKTVTDKTGNENVLDEAPCEISEDSASDADTDIELIEEKPVCIDLSDDDYFKSSDEELPFNVDELNSTKTNLLLPNIKIDPTWEVHEEAVQEILDDEQTGPDTVSVSEADVEKPENVKTWLTQGYDMDEAWINMPSDTQKWKILERDRIHIRVRDRGPRCNKCRQVGHMANQCPRRVTKCWLCGESGHQEPRCPNTICTRCGRSTQFFTVCCGRCKDLVRYVCKTCGSKGHKEALCPDFWRRYHLTTEEGAVIQTSKSLKRIPERWCSGCAQQGHFEHACNYYNRSHIPCKPHILKYQDVYNMSSSQAKATASTSTSTENFNANAEDVENEDSEINDESLSELELVHRKIHIEVDLNNEAHQALITPKGNNILKEITEASYMSYSIQTEANKHCIHLKGHPTDLLLMKEQLYQFIQGTNVNYRKIILANRELQTLSSPAGKTLLATLNTNNKIANKLEVALPIKAVYLYGDALDLLLAQYKIQKLIIGQPLPTTFSQNDSNPVKMKIPDFVCDGLKAQMKIEPLERWSKYYKLKWHVEDEYLVFDGDINNAKKVKKLMHSFLGRKPMKAADAIKDIDKLFEYINSVSTEEDPVELLNQCEYKKLNILLFCKFRHTGTKTLEKIKQKLGNQIFEAVYQTKAVTSIKAYYEEKKPPAEYVKLIAKFNKDKAKAKAKLQSFHPPENATVSEKEQEEIDNLYTLEFDEPAPLPAPVVQCYDVSVHPAHCNHLIQTAEGNAFLKEMQKQVSVEVLQEASMLKLYCSENQKVEAMKQINFYFAIFELEFPKKPTLIYRHLLGSLAKANLDYYLTDCAHLYRTLRDENMHVHRPSVFAKLHGVLFAKCEFLEGAKHVDNLMQFMLILRDMSPDEPISVGDFLSIRLSYFYLFYPFSNDINYDFLMKLVQPPVIPILKIRDLENTKSALISRMQTARKVCKENNNALMEAEIGLFERHMLQLRYSRASVEVAAAFFNDNFPMIK